MYNQEIPGTPNTTYGCMRNLLLGQGYALDGVKLHELYFNNLTGLYAQIHGAAKMLIEKNYGDMSKFMKLLYDACLAARGWVVAAINYNDGGLYIYGQDSHDNGPIWEAMPVIVIDVYEHAYMIDFGIDRKKYLDAVFRNLDWHIINQRIILSGSMFKYMNI